MTNSVPQMSWLKKYGSLLSFLTLLSVLGGSYFVYIHWFDKPQTFVLIDNASDTELTVMDGPRDLGVLHAHSYFKIEILGGGNTRIVAKDATGHVVDEGEFPVTRAKHGMKCYVYNIAGKGKYGIASMEYSNSSTSTTDPRQYEPMGKDSKVFSIDTDDHPQVRDCELDFAFPESVESHSRGPTVRFVGLICHIDKNNQPMCPGI